MEEAGPCSAEQWGSGQAAFPGREEEIDMVQWGQGSVWCVCVRVYACVEWRVEGSNQAGRTAGREEHADIHHRMQYTLAQHQLQPNKEDKGKITNC